MLKNHLSKFPSWVIMQSFGATMIIKSLCKITHALIEALSYPWVASLKGENASSAPIMAGLSTTKAQWFPFLPGTLRQLPTMSKSTLGIPLKVAALFGAVLVIRWIHLSVTTLPLLRKCTIKIGYPLLAKKCSAMIGSQLSKIQSISLTLTLFILTLVTLKMVQ